MCVDAFHVFLFKLGGCINDPNHSSKLLKRDYVPDISPNASLAHPTSLQLLFAFLTLIVILVACSLLFTEELRKKRATLLSKLSSHFDVIITSEKKPPSMEFMKRLICVLQRVSWLL